MESALCLWLSRSTGTYSLFIRHLFHSVQGHLREAKCHLVMGETVAALMSYQKVLQLDPNNNMAQTEVSCNRGAPP